MRKKLILQKSFLLGRQYKIKEMIGIKISEGSVRFVRGGKLDIQGWHKASQTMVWRSDGDFAKDVSYVFLCTLRLEHISHPRHLAKTSASGIPDSSPFLQTTIPESVVILHCSVELRKFTL
ncbi:hypothetical protein CBL_07918 [Carabus blaptoides fortunei]